MDRINAANLESFLLSRIPELCRYVEDTHKYFEPGENSYALAADLLRLTESVEAYTIHGGTDSADLLDRIFEAVETVMRDGDRDVSDALCIDFVQDLPVRNSELLHRLGPAALRCLAGAIGSAGSMVYDESAIRVIKELLRDNNIMLPGDDTA